MKIKGFKLGVIFFLISLIIPFTIFIPLKILFFVEGIGSAVSSIFQLNNIGGATFYSCITLSCFSFITYAFAIIYKREDAILFLLFLFLAIFIFINPAFLYFEIRHAESRVDPQLPLAILYIPFFTCIVYPIFGLIHDKIQTKRLL